MSRILLLLDHRENRRLLMEELSSRYDIVVAETDAALDDDFDLCIFDGPALERLWQRVEARKGAEDPIFLPFLFVTSRQGVGLATRHLGRSVDELIITPIERVELQARVEILLRARHDISERKKTEEALRESEARMSFAMETSHIGVWNLDLVDQTAYRSLEHDRIFGYAELLPLWTYAMFLDHVLPEDRTLVASKYQHAIDTQGDWNFECRIRRADGEVHWIWAAGRHQFDASGAARHMAGIVQDITERKQVEEALRESEERLSLFIENAPAAIAMFDHDMRYLAASRRWRDDYGLGEREIIGKSHYEIFPEIPERLERGASARACRRGGRGQGRPFRAARRQRAVAALGSAPLVYGRGWCRRHRDLHRGYHRAQAR